MTPERAAFLAGLPRKVLAAGALITDAQGRVLLVKPTYKPGWEIPGGVVEVGESPRDACQRELLEELGYAEPLGRLLVFESKCTPEGDSVMLLFDGGICPDEACFRIPEQELEATEFVEPARLREYVRDAKASRLEAGLVARAQGSMAELHSTKADEVE